jgi:hypothetical protein
VTVLQLPAAPHEAEPKGQEQPQEQPQQERSPISPAAV